MVCAIVRFKGIIYSIGKMALRHSFTHRLCEWKYVAKSLFVRVPLMVFLIDQVKLDHRDQE